jgi:uncharacterized damage-inducible protein DinB
MEITTIQPFLDYFERVRERTMKLVKCIPPDKLEWTYRDGKFTLGDLARHLVAIERYLFAESVRGGRNAYPGCGRELADGYENVLRFMESMHAESMAIFSTIKDDDLQRKVLAADGSSITMWKLLRSMIEHEAHHRGEMYVYLGMLGVAVPPLYGLTSEQVQEIAAKNAG